MMETGPEYMVVDEKTGRVLGTNLTLNQARLLTRPNVYDYRIHWQKRLIKEKHGSPES